MEVARDRISASMLTRPGARCWTYTNARPVFAGIAFRNSVNASSPPADAPMPTMATGWPSEGGGELRAGSGLLAGAGRAAEAFFFLDVGLDFIATVLGRS